MSPVEIIIGSLFIMIVAGFCAATMVAILRGWDETDEDQ